MQEANLIYNHVKYTHAKSEAAINKILSCDDNQRLDQLVHIFSKYQMTGKRYEAKAWHAYFRHIAANPVIFYENNTAIFNEDNQYDNEQNNSIIIHGNLHIGQFQYYFDDVTDERIFHIQNKIKVLAPFTRDLKRLATNLALIAYCKGFNSIEMIEILEAFTRQYIKSVLSSNRNLKRQHSVASDQLYRNRNPFRFQRECSMIGLVETEHEMQKIDWQSVDSVKNLLILTEQLAMTTANLHCQPIITISPMVNDAMPKNIYSYKQLIQTALSSTDQQQQLIDKICYFSMIYAEIAERDHRLFFKNFRNERIFKSINTLKNGQIQYPLNNTCSVSILIVGGGIGGMATALSFARAGVRVRLIEKNKEFTEVGAGMQLAPNCSRVLDRLGILKKVQTNAVYPKQIVWMDALSGERLTAIDLGEKFIETFGYPYIVVHRADLLNVLYQACLESSMITMETNRMVINVDERPKSLMIECADGIRYDCKMVIAADGLWSSLRKFVCDDGQPISVGYVTYRGTVGIDEVSKEAGLENVQFWIGPDMHLVQYPIRGGKLFNQAAVFKSNKLPDETDQWGTKEELNERFSNGCNHVKNSLKLIQKNFRWPVYDRNALSKWSRDRLVLLGDAAHPMLQYAGQGAAQALEDACTLTDIYKKYGLSNYNTIFNEYEQERIPRTSKVVQFARDIGVFAHYNGISKIVRDAILRMHDINDYDFIKWLYGENKNEKE